MTQERTFILAGGGTGGHIYPNIAVAEALHVQAASQGMSARIILAVSQRAVDHEVAAHEPYEVMHLSVEPARRSLRSVGRFLRTTRQSRNMLIEQMHSVSGAMLCTGGFVSVPAVLAARRMRWPVAVVNLDAVPGKASALLSKLAAEAFTTGSPMQGGSARFKPVGFPVRQAARATLPATKARRLLGLHETNPTLLVTAGSQGARSLNHMMHLLASQISRCQPLLDVNWQVYHLSGREDQSALQQAYQSAGIHAVVRPFEPKMGLAWAAADLAISRAGAGSVAEVLANAVPTLFFPYPYHADEHQKLNAMPLVDAQAAILCKDHIEANENLNALLPILTPLLAKPKLREEMHERLQQMAPEDGARMLADWLLTRH